VVPFRNDAIDAAPDIGVSWRSDYIDGVVRRDGGFVVIINLEKLFSDAGPALASLVQPARQSA
jgi:purine-binding chemotaxis protein CheW